MDENLEAKSSGSDVGDELIQRHDGCGYCLLELMMTDKQRRLSVLDNEVSEKLDVSIAYASCHSGHQTSCEMMQAFLRSNYDNRSLTQWHDMEILKLDLSQNKKRDVNPEEAWTEWARPRESDNGQVYSLAERYKEIWDVGLNANGNQTISSQKIYEIAVSSIYSLLLKGLVFIKNESKIRQEKGIVL